MEISSTEKLRKFDLFIFHHGISEWPYTQLKQKELKLRKFQTLINANQNNLHNIVTKQIGNLHSIVTKQINRQIGQHHMTT